MTQAHHVGDGGMPATGRPATRECLACGHQNKPGAFFCAACFTSLNLKLCAACEAANALAADRCHECGASLIEGVPPQEATVQKEAEPDVPVAEPVAEPDVRGAEPIEAGEHVIEQAASRIAVPMLQHSRPPTRTGRVATLWFVSIALASVAGYYLAGGQVPMLAATRKVTAVEPQASPEPVRAWEGPIETVPPPSPAAKSVPQRPAKPPVAQAAPVHKRAPASGVTHTRASPTGSAIAATAAPAAAVVEPAPAGAAVSEAPLPQAAAEPAHARVTHTKPSRPPEQPVEPVSPTPDNRPAGCAPSVAALGLCPAR